MLTLQRLLRVARWLAPLVLIAAPIVAGAQGQQPSPEQLEIFRNLPPDQQRALLEAARSGGTSQEESAQPKTPQAQQPVAGQAPQSAQPTTRTNVRAVEPQFRIGPRTTLLLAVRTNEELAAGIPDRTVAPIESEEKVRVESRRDQLRAANPYRLDDDGRLTLPFLPPIELNGLTDRQAAQRLNADPRLAGLTFTVILLPVEAVGIEALKPFGYELFKQDAERFSPATDLPVPSGYVVGAGDNITVELFGKKTSRYRLVVSRDGALNVPDLGPIQVNGLTFDQVQADIERRVSEQMIGVRASVTMGQLRSLRVFVVGDVANPGSHAIASGSTITSALFASGGVSEVGSIRSIELKRRGTTVTRFDLYDLLLRGDTSRDLQLQQGDAVFVPPVGMTAGISGQVRRPAIYEFRDGGSVGELVQLAGGLNPASAQRAAKLLRIDTNGERTAFDLDLSAAADRARALQAGDIVTVPKVLDEYAGSVTVEGYVNRPGPYAWRPSMRLTDLLGGLEALKLNADQRYVLIRRERMPDRRIDVISADAVAAFAARGTAADPVIESRDRIIVFSRQSDRGTSLSSLMEELRLQARDNAPVPTVSVSGRVRAPGDYPYESNMTVSDVLRAGGGMDDAAFPGSAELTRYDVIDGNLRKTEVVDVDLRAAASGNLAADIAVSPYDVLVIKEVPEWREQESITVSGEVRFPGRYPIRRGETLSSIIKRAGGFTDTAFSDGSVFMRDEIKKQEREQMDVLADRLQTDLALLAVQSAQSKDQAASETLAAGQGLLQQLRTTEPKGRLVVDIDRAMARVDSEDDIQVRDGDTLLVPRLRQYVTVIGEVQNSTSHVWKSGHDQDDYINMSGGTTRRADEKRTYVVRANGSVVTSNDNRWFSNASGDIRPGDTVVVPIDAERMRPLPLWTAITTIIYNLAIAAAAVNSF